MNRWFRSAVSHKPAMTAAEEDQHLQKVEHALLQLLNDDIASADRILKEGDSSYHHLGRGISSFIASMLGVEKELLKDAATALQDAESRTWDDMKKAQRDPEAFRSHIYPPGTEYLLCYCIMETVSQLTSAIVAVLSGSVTEAIKGFYKLRKAYLTLDSIMAIETKYLKERTGNRRDSLSSTRAPSHLSRQESAKASPVAANGSASKPANEDNPLVEKPPIGHANGSTEDLKFNLGDLNLVSTPSASQSIALIATRAQSRLLEIDPASVGITHHTDIFIHSGTRLCYGALLVVFSMIENPLFNKILYIVGFKGDRERGTRYLWQATRFNNFNSAIAGFALLGYYNGLVGFCDILPTDPGADDDLSGYPRARCEVLLTEMRKRYPDSKLWKLEEARTNAYNKNLGAAIKVLADNSDSQMKQIATINMFEMSLTTMFYHDYELCAKCWIQCAELSQWSPTLYAYMTGAAYLELYRNTRESDPEAAKVWKEKATEFIRKGPPLAGRQKVMSKQLPFDIYVCRKVEKWDRRAKAWGCDLVDATGVSPLTEMIFLWNGCKKQATEQFEQSLKCLEWSRTSHPEKFEGDLDEEAIHALLKACILRNMGNSDKSRSILTTEILNHDRHEFKGHLKDDWTNPSAHYEMACLAWNEKDLEGNDHKAKVLDCEQWLEKAQKWGESYVLDTRLSVKITTSLITIKRHKSIMGI